MKRIKQVGSWLWRHLAEVIHGGITALLLIGVLVIVGQLGTLFGKIDQLTQDQKSTAKAVQTSQSASQKDSQAIHKQLGNITSQQAKDAKDISDLSK